MAETKLQNYTVQEKLNKMDMDVISVIPTVNFDHDGGGADAFTAGDIVAPITKIPNAVSVNGGVSLLQNIIIIDTDAQDTTHELFFFGVDPSEDAGVTMPLSNAALTGVDEDALFYDNQFLGQVASGSFYEIGTSAFFELSNIGKLLKATSDAKDIYFFSITTGTAPTYTTATSLEFKFGVIKD